MKAILEAFANGWNEAKGKYPEIIKSGSEEEVTEKLRSEVDCIMRNESVTGFNKLKYESIVRGAKVEKFDGTGIDKAPDLTIRKQEIHPGLVDTHFEALFIECKLIEKKKKPLLYIKNGIKRFVDGEYAWSMSQALMLAYVRDESTLPLSLKDTFIRNSKKPLISRCSPINNEFDLAFAGQGVYKTLHTRDWEHLRYGSPGNISIYHTWLKA